MQKNNPPHDTFLTQCNPSRTSLITFDRSQTCLHLILILRGMTCFFSPQGGLQHCLERTQMGAWLLPKVQAGRATSTGGLDTDKTRSFFFPPIQYHLQIHYCIMVSNISTPTCSVTLALRTLTVWTATKQFILTVH